MYALFLDIEKAFDRVVLDNVIWALERILFGTGFVQWIKLTDPLARAVRCKKEINPHLVFFHKKG